MNDKFDMRNFLNDYSSRNSNRNGTQQRVSQNQRNTNRNGGHQTWNQYQDQVNQQQDFLRLQRQNGRRREQEAMRQQEEMRRRQDARRRQNEAELRRRQQNQQRQRQRGGNGIFGNSFLGNVFGNNNSRQRNTNNRAQNRQRTQRQRNNNQRRRSNDNNQRQQSINDVLGGNNNRNTNQRQQRQRNNQRNNNNNNYNLNFNNIYDSIFGNNNNTNRQQQQQPRRQRNNNNNNRQRPPQSNSNFGNFGFDNLFNNSGSPFQFGNTNNFFQGLFGQNSQQQSQQPQQGRRNPFNFGFPPQGRPQQPQREQPHSAPPTARNALRNLACFPYTQSRAKRLKFCGEDTECVICLSPFDERLCLLPCQHIFHENCVKRWLVEHNTCPVCRFELPLEDPALENSRRKRMVDKFSLNGLRIMELGNESERVFARVEEAIALASSGRMSPGKARNVLSQGNGQLFSMIQRLDSFESFKDIRTRDERRQLIQRIQAMHKVIDFHLENFFVQ